VLHAFRLSSSSQEGGGRGGGEGLGENGGKQRLPLCDRDEDRDQGTPHQCHHSVFCSPSVDTVDSVTEGLHGPRRVPWAGSTVGLIPRDEEPQAPPWLSSFGVLLSTMSPNPP